MNLLKSNIIIGAFLLVLLSGCNLFTEGKKKLNEYCPGLNINIDGVSWTKTELKKVYELTYGDKFENQAETYFTNSGNGYVEEKTDDFSNIEINNRLLINNNDHVFVKTIQKDKGTAKVVFDETTQRIVIIEYSYSKK